MKSFILLLIVKKMNIIYWCPYLTKIATITSVINSCNSLKNTKYIPKIINSCGEWQFYDKKENLINFLNKVNIHKFLPKHGFLNSRISLILISLITFIPLIKYLKKRKPEFLIIHLLTSLPLMLNSIFKFETKIILRISGMPKMNLIREILWKCTCKNVYAITVPTEETYQNLIKSNFISKEKIFILRDPVININSLNNLNQVNDNKNLNKKFLLSVGRLTKQKNHFFLIKSFEKIQMKYKNLDLIILGEGELRNKLKLLTKKLNLENKIHFPGYKNPVPYYKKALCFVSTSLWEDPGFTMIEAAFFNCSIISSNCESGPKEFLKNNEAGFLFKSNDEEDFLKQFSSFYNSKEEQLFKKKLLAKKQSKMFTQFNHRNKLISILEFVK